MITVSIIVPCRNEVKFAGKCFQSIIDNDYPKDQLEVLVIDGASEDGTRAIVQAYVRRHSFIRLLENPRRVTPAALNVGIESAKGKIVMRVDAHAHLEKDYISRCVEALDQYGADNAGGVWKIIPRSDTQMGRMIVASLSYPFGVGNAYYRFTGSREPQWVDTVPFFCCQREVFQKIGLFNENLQRGQDMEFNLRLKRAGLKTLLVPDIVSYYYARSDLGSFWKHNWSNGVWAILPFIYSEAMPVSWRHLVPLVFVAGLVGSAILGLMAKPFFWIFGCIVLAYALANLTASVHIAWRERDPRYFFIMPWIFVMLHVGYGLGSLWGVIKCAISPGFWGKFFA